MGGITGAEWLAIVAGIAAIVWVNWYFFLARGTTRGRREAREGRTGR